MLEVQRSYLEDTRMMKKGQSSYWQQHLFTTIFLKSVNDADDDDDDDDDDDEHLSEYVDEHEFP